MKKQRKNKNQVKSIAYDRISKNTRFKFMTYEKNCARNKIPTKKRIVKINSKRRKYLVVPQKNSSWITLCPPETFCIYNDNFRYKTFKYIEDLEKIILGSKNNIFLDFFHVKESTAAAVLILFATLDSILIKHSISQKIKLKKPANQRIQQIFKHMGFFHLLSHKETITVDYPKIAQWKHIDGTKFEGKKLSEFIDKIMLSAGINLEDSGTYSTDYYVGIKEAICNSVEHAYDASEYADRNNSLILNKWWVYGCFNEAEQSIIFLICDLGMGIPRSLQIRHGAAVANIFEAVGNVVRRDCDFISAALVLQKSRTGNAERGKGLPELCAYVDDSETGYLKINSYKGQLLYEANSTHGPILESFKKGVNGTIIEWNVPLTSIREKLSNHEKASI